MFQGQTFLGRPYSEARAWFEAHDPDVAPDSAGLKSSRFGIALYAPAAEKAPHESVEGVAIFERGYYERTKADSERLKKDLAKQYGVKIKV